MDPHISPEQRRKLAVGLLKSAIEAPPEQKEGLIHAALLNLTSADSGEVQRVRPPARRPLMIMNLILQMPEHRSDS
jgi:hypothetical protein